jgi:hypothetical protein
VYLGNMSGMDLQAFSELPQNLHLS